jgi:hypothetical protein
LGTNTPTGPGAANWELERYVCLAFKEPNPDCVPVYEYRNSETEGYKYSVESQAPGWERIRTVFYAPKNATNYSEAIHGWGFNNNSFNYQTKGDSPPIGTYWQSRETPGGAIGSWSEQRPMDDYGVVFQGVSTRISEIPKN